MFSTTGANQFYFPLGILFSTTSHVFHYITSLKPSKAKEAFLGP